MVKFDIMDEDNNLNIRNWDYYEPTSVKGNLGLQLMSPTMPEKPFLGARSNVIITSVNGGFHQRDIGVSQPMFPMEYTRDVWAGQREKLLNMLPGNHNSAEVLPETASTHHMQMFQPPDSASDEMLDQVEEASVEEKENGPKKKRQLAKAPKSPKAKKGTRAPRAPKPEDSPSVQQGLPRKPLKL